MPDFLFRGAFADLDPEVFELTQIESERQVRRLILIPSESSAPEAVRMALSTTFNNLYAEGYPDEETRQMTEAEILDYEARLGHYRRYSDPRYYKGVEYADVMEALARRRCAELFAANGLHADDLYVNVQALSGGPANNAVYHALVEPGAVVMGMDLMHGGHLSHGSNVNRSGKFHKIVSYGVDPETEKIDYDAMEALALEHKPKMIIGGYSSYSWQADWQRYREIADKVGAILMADIAHVAGLVAAGVYPSPVGIADVITFTTHKSLCGPRGAVILASDRRLARKLDRAIFPGEQGGPHVNTMAAQAVAFKLAMTDQFKALQQQILDNCAALNSAMQEQGLRIPFGGSNTHLTNVDCSTVVGEDGTSLSGDQAARILDLVGIVCNRNTIPGDVSAASPSGIRLGTPWITQRGFNEDDCRTLAEMIATTLQHCQPYSIGGRRGSIRRAKIDFELLNEMRVRVRDLALSKGMDYEIDPHGYPHFYYIDDSAPQGEAAVIEMEGVESEAVLRWVTDVLPMEMGAGEARQVQLRPPGGDVQGVLTRAEDENFWSLAVPATEAVRLVTWLRDLSDGFISLDAQDLHKKLPGPFTARLLAAGISMPQAESSADSRNKPWFVGINGDGGEAKPLPLFEWDEPEGELMRTALHATHQELGAKMVPFAGWDMPVWYSSVIEEHLATRHAAGLFDVSHMGVFQVEGPQASAFLDSVVTNDVASLRVGESHYTQFLAPDGSVIDDTMIYRRREQVYLVVVNASNDAKDWAWLNAVKAGEVRIDEVRPWARAYGRGARLRNLRLPEAGDEMRVDLALQGPLSREILLALGCDEDTAGRLKAMPWAGVMEGEFGGFDLVVSRTGYTGERMAFELFVHPGRSVDLWKDLLRVGEPLGLKPVGLAARDSLRTEAGLPLYGHEMAGPKDLGVADSGFGAYVKTYKPWFIGRRAFLEQEARRQHEIVRFRFDDKGVRMAHYGDPVVDRRGRVIGMVTSCAVDQEGYLLGQAYVERKFQAEGSLIAVFQSASDKVGKPPAELELGDRVAVPTPAKVLTRFPR